MKNEFFYEMKDQTVYNFGPILMLFNLQSFFIGGGGGS